MEFNFQTAEERRSELEMAARRGGLDFYRAEKAREAEREKERNRFKPAPVSDQNQERTQSNTRAHT